MALEPIFKPMAKVRLATTLCILLTWAFTVTPENDLASSHPCPGEVLDRLSALISSDESALALKSPAHMTNCTYTSGQPTNPIIEGKTPSYLTQRVTYLAYPVTQLRLGVNKRRGPEPAAGLARPQTEPKLELGWSWRSSCSRSWSWCLSLSPNRSLSRCRSWNWVMELELEPEQLEQPEWRRARRRQQQEQQQ